MPLGVFPGHRAQMSEPRTALSVDGAMSGTPPKMTPEDAPSSCACRVKPVWFWAWFWKPRPRKPTRLNILHTIFVTAGRTADFQTTTGIRRIVENSGNVGDLLAFFEERLLPVEEIEANRLAEEVLANPPDIGYLTISNALQWRLQYRRAITEAGTVDGILRVR